MDTTEITSEAEKQLNDTLRKCRFCFRMIIDERKSVEISQEIRMHFNSVTQIQLLDSDIFATKICQMCEGDLRVFVNFRNDLIEKQKALYDLAGLHENHYSNIKVEQYDAHEEFFDDQSMLNETEGIEMEEVIEDEANGDQFEAIEFDDTYEHSNQEVLQVEYPPESKVSMKIEKLERESEFVYQEDETEFEFMEEFVEDEDVSDVGEAANFTDLVVCQPCQIEVPKNQLELHVKLIHKLCSCQQCGQKFENKISCRRHITKQHGVSVNPKIKRPRKYFCHLCVKEYENRRQLEDHVRSYHEKERNAQCTICLKKFFYRDLKKHMEHVHGEKNISCELCGKKYTCIENLRLHMRYHNEPKFKCQHQGCGKKFHQKILLEHHELKHSAEKPFSCENCTQIFFSLRDLKRHNERVHNKVMRPCPLCEAEFGRKDKLRLHVIKKHKDLSDSEKQNILEQVKVMRWNET